MVLIAPTRHDIFGRSVMRFAMDHPWRFLQLLSTFTMWPPIATPALCREMLFSASMPDDELRDYHSKMQNESYWVATQLLFRLGPKPSPPTDTPALVLGGEMDRAVSRKDVEQIARCYGIGAHFIPGMAHDQMLDAGWRKAAEHIDNWVRRIVIA